MVIFRQQKSFGPNVIYFVFELHKVVGGRDRAGGEGGKDHLFFICLQWYGIGYKNKIKLWRWIPAGGGDPHPIINGDCPKVLHMRPHFEENGAQNNDQIDKKILFFAKG